MRCAAAICTVAVLAVAPAPAPGQERSGFSDEAVAKAIGKGIRHLWSKQKGNGSWGRFEAWGKKWPVGPSALIAYALLESGVSPQHPKMAKALNWLEKQKSAQTYELAMLCNAWLIADWRTNGKYRKVFERDVDLLVRGMFAGAYTYGCVHQRDGKRRWDNSNSQYGLLGVWAGQRGLGEIPTRYWDVVRVHWLRSQNRDGGWGYAPHLRPGSSAPMTTAGLASLFVCFDNLYAARFVSCTADTEYPPIKKGLGWMDRQFPRTVRDTPPNYYYLYGVERVGLASGYKYFGKADWYKLGAKLLIQAQRPNGSWPNKNNHSGNEETATAFALLFLIRGQHAVLFNKLEFPGDWNNRPRDLASVTRWMSRTFESTVNWQIINLKVPVREWHDAPILYVSGAQAPQFADKDIDKLRTFVLQGGTLLGVTECGGTGFKEGIRQVYRRMFPQHELTPVAADHPLYHVHFRVPPLAKFEMISNGVRPLVIHTDVDLARWWQLGRPATRRWAFDAAANLALYMTDKGSLRHRGVSLWPAKPNFQPSRTAKLARLKHSGNFDPEPLAYERFARLMGERHKVRVEVLGPMPIRDLTGSGAKVAALTGTGKLTLNAGERTALKQFVQGGGTVVLDAAGGSKTFADAARARLAEMFGVGSLRPVAITSSIYQAKGMKVDRVRYRRQTRKRLGLNHHRPNLQACFIGNRAAVVLSREDITAGLVGYPSYSCDGYDPESAFALMRNIILTAGGARR